ncbi:Tripeptidyl-peptidase sed3 [Lachnellula suecica]|uniref:tripeptidyl-peptidase II n=1 Tax=Lachnellula suecica TaxID=602035 RepID=A0A8T9CEJ2_9HELO|nr:Tripeptidyl-peptidase sed3 [Lachnellula suecica]
MVSFTSLLVVLAISASSFASPVNSAREDDVFKSSVVESLSGPPLGWTKDESEILSKSDLKILLRIHLVQQDMDKFHELAMQIATPGHELYGSHMQQHLIDAMIAPKDESKDLVMQWLEGEGLGDAASLSPRADSIIIKSTVDKIEKLLKAEYTAFIHTTSGKETVRTLEYSLPDVLKGHVDMVQPTTFFGFQSMRSTISEVHPVTEEEMNTDAVSEVAAVTGCTGSTITPKCLANLYNFASDTAAQTAGKFGIAGFLEQYAIKTDLTTFMNSYAVFANKATSFTCTTVNGGSCPTSAASAGDEANLDVQYGRAIAEEIPLTYYSTGGLGEWVGSGTNTNEPYLEFLNYMLGLADADLPNTLSISYGDDEATVPASYATNACNLFSQLGARGVSILVASGDSGVGDTCSINGTKQFQTAFPASCPWVTTVGGTTGNTPEGAWTGSGGGFSYLFAQPSYQKAAVATWSTTDTAHATYAQYFNTSGRAYPDIAAQSTNFVIVVDGSSEGVSGTSCATPTFAAVVQLLNSDRIAKGKKGLGFLNPWLYSNATSGLTDISKGKNTGCSGVISGAGFNAVAGWDPATGLGTPNYAKLLAISQST